MSMGEPSLRDRRAFFRIEKKVMDVASFAVRQFIPHPMMLFGASTYDESGAPYMALVS